MKLTKRTLRFKKSTLTALNKGFIVTKVHQGTQRIHITATDKKTLKNNEFDNC